MRFKHKRCKNSQDLRVGTRPCQYIVFQERVADLDGWSVTHEAKQQTHTLYSLHRAYNALIAHLGLSSTDIGEQRAFDR